MSRVPKRRTTLYVRTGKHYTEVLVYWTLHHLDS